jgi:hypothetical protein
MSNLLIQNLDQSTEIQDIDSFTQRRIKGGGYSCDIREVYVCDAKGNCVLVGLEPVCVETK